MDEPSATSEREFRSALVFYGGVSLAIYENGIARSFYDAVRKRGIFEPLLEKMKTKVVVDVISGSSAGGINGLLLAAALETGHDFADTAMLWREAGGFGQLLRPLGQADRALSLLQGETYYLSQLRQAFHRMYAEEPGEDWAKEIDVFVTGTDLAGQFAEFEDGLHNTITTKDHRLIFHLKHRRGRKWLGSVPEAVAGLDVDQHRRVQADVLASVARVTSSFPGAFPPFTVDEFGDGQRIARDLPAVQEGFQPRIRKALSFLAGVCLGKTDGAEKDHVLIDGGVLDNKPFGPVLRAIFHRAPSDKGEAVERRVFYIEPDPAVFDKCRRDFTPLRVAFESLIGLPGYDSIAADVRGIHQHNEKVRMVRATRDRAAARDGAGGTANAVYLEALAQAVATFALGLDPCQINNTSASPKAVAHVADWATRDRTMKESVELLRQLDLGYPLRRLFHLLYARSGDQDVLPARHLGSVARALKAFKLLRDVWLKPVDGDGLEALRQTFDAGAFDARLARLQGYVDGCWYREPAASEVPMPQTLTPQDWLKEALNQGRLSKFVEQVAQWRPQDTSCPTPLRPIATVDAQLARLLEGEAHRVWSTFPQFDAEVYPAELAAEIYELDEIELIRIAPGDARTPGIDGPDKITGDRLGHFSAFLRKDWRTNDIAWGHCDGLRQLLSALLNDDGWTRLGTAVDERWMADVAACCCCKEWQALEAGAAAGTRGGLLGALDDLEKARIDYLEEPHEGGLRERFREALITVAQNAAAKEYVDTIVADTKQQNDEWGWRDGPQRTPVEDDDPLAQLVAWKIGAETIADGIAPAAMLEYGGQAGLLAWGMLGASATHGVAGGIYQNVGRVLKRVLRMAHYVGTQMRKGRYRGLIAIGSVILVSLGYTAWGFVVESPTRIVIGCCVTYALCWVFDAVLRGRLCRLAAILGLAVVLGGFWFRGGVRELAGHGLRKAADVVDGRGSARVQELGE